MAEMFVPHTQKGVFANLAAWIVAVIVLIVLAGASWGVVQWVSAPTLGKFSARKQIQGSGAYRIAAYNRFFDICAAVQTDEAALSAQRAELASAAGGERSRILANIAGITADRADAINQYNADAAKSYTLGQFRASGLPYTLMLGREHTSCVVAG